MECGNELLKFSFRQFLHRNSYGTAVEKVQPKIQPPRNENIVVFWVKAIMEAICVNVEKKNRAKSPCRENAIDCLYHFFHIGLTEGEKKTNVN